MAKIIHEAGGIELINGIEFKPGEDGWESGELTAEQVALFDNVPGFRVEGEVQQTKVAAPAPKPAPAAKTNGKKSQPKAEQAPAAPAEAPAQTPEGGAEGAGEGTGEGAGGSKAPEDESTF